MILCERSSHLNPRFSFERKRLMKGKILMACAAGACMLSSCGRIDKGEKEAATVVWSFLGAPGSGKGTIGEQCVKELKFATVSTGALLRAFGSRQDEMGKQIEALVKAGKLVPDDLVANMVKHWLTENMGKYKALIVDGFPRTAEQTKIFLELLKKDFPQAMLRIARIVVNNESIVARLSSRLVCSNKSCQAIFSKTMFKDGEEENCNKCGSPLIRREDDKEEVVRARLQDYAKNESAIIDIYKSSGVKIEEINAEGKSIDQVFQDFTKLVGA